jgi:peptide/nickel transport system substrate-binding protein
LCHLFVILAMALASCGDQPTATPAAAPPGAADTPTTAAAPPAATNTTAAAPSGPTATSGTSGVGQETTLSMVDPQNDIPANFSEAPMLKDLVASGKLPALKDRLPKDIEVVQNVEGVGTYGGTWHEVHAAPDMGSLKMVVAYEPPIRWKPDYTGFEPGVAKSIEWSKDGKIVTLKLREGIKWSDGQPFTTDDLKFWWEDLAGSPDYKVALPPSWAHNADGSLIKMTFPDQYTWVMEFAEAAFVTPYILAQGFWEWSEPGNPLKPKHYLEQFLPKNGGDWKTMEAKSKWWENPDFPTIFAWHVTSFTPSQKVVLERNPYYWKVDPQGNQLPYIDRIESEEVSEPEVRVLNLSQGKYDASFRGSDDPNQIPLLSEKASANNYHLADGWMNGAGGWPSWIIDQTYKAKQDAPNDAVANEIRALLRNAKFRQALSYALDRDRVIQTAWGGIGTPQQATISPQSWHFQGTEGQALFKEWAASYADHDTTKANALLDEVMGPKGSDGFRTLKSGAPFQLIVDVTDWGTEAVQVAAATTLEQNFKDVGVNTLQKNLVGSPDGDLRAKNGLFMIRSSHMSEVDLLTYPAWVFPTNNERAWPLTGRWYQTGGTEGEKPEAGSVEERLHDIYYRALAAPDLATRQKIIQEGIRIHINEGPFILGAAGDQPMPVVIKNNFHGVPKNGILGPWAPGSPGNTHPEQYYFSDK